MLASCSKFLDRQPLDRITEEEMTFSATEMKLYSNQFYVVFPGWGQNHYTGGIFWIDNASDNMIQGVYNNNTQVSGTVTVPASGGGWGWGNVRAVNYFLANYHITKDPPEAVNTYVGEMYFWRAWFYFDLMKRFGDLPWYNRPLSTTDMNELQAPRLKRNIIADSILADLDKAVKLLAPAGKAEPLRINQGAALTLLSRVALYEGTWEKYHAGTPFGVANANYNKYFQQAAAAAEQLMNSGLYEITSIESDPRFGYWRLFNQKDLSSNKEMVLWKKFDKAIGMTHFGQNMLPYEGSNTGVSKQLVDAYLCTDGKPISISPLYKGDDSITSAVTNRDPRLAQTILVRGYPRQILNGDTTVKFSEPDINKPGGQKSTTGYMIFKGLAPDDADATGAATANIIFRYAEALLNYAEAKAELGLATQAVLDRSINVLRDRVSMPHLTVAVGFSDPKWDFPSLSPLLNEIRRERRVELGIEGYRFDDLMRWRAHHLLKRPLLGAKYSQFLGKPFNPPLEGIPVSSDGYIFPYKGTPAANGWQFNENKNYLLPLPTNELVLNPNLKQNPGY
jgi:hypothetical protein